MPRDAFEVDLDRTRLTLVVDPDQSVLEVVREAGVDISSSCQEGARGTCQTRVLEGEVDHRDSVLTPEEQAEHQTVFLCVWRAASRRLVLDL